MTQRGVLWSGAIVAGRRGAKEITVYDRARIVSRCVSCHVAYRTTPPDICPRCGADNRAWRAWLKAGWPAHLNRFFFYTPWGWLALVSLLLPPVSWGAFDFHPLYFQTLVLSLSFLLGVAGLILLFVYRDRLWVYELTRRGTWQPGQGAQTFPSGLLAWGGIGFFVFLVMGGILSSALAVSTWQREMLGFVGPERWGVMAVIGLTFAGQTWAAGIYSLFSYGQWIWKTFPGPVFMNETNLSQLVEGEARLRIQLKLRKQKKLMMQVLSAVRTERGGVTLDLRAEMPTQKLARGHFLRRVQYWQAIANRWGKIKQLGQDGQIQYILDLARPYAPPPKPKKPKQLLQGDLILQDHPASAKMEDAIINAVVATAYKRRRR